MKKQLLLMIAGLALVSCNVEYNTVNKALLHDKELEAIAAKLFAQYNTQTFAHAANDSVQLTKKEKRFLQYKLRCPFIHIIYDDDNPAFLATDSVVMFTRAGLQVIGKQHNIIVDMRKKPRNGIPETGITCAKLTDRIYYIKDMMPEF